MFHTDLVRARSMEMEHVLLTGGTSTELQAVFQAAAYVLFIVNTDRRGTAGAGTHWRVLAFHSRGK